MNSLLERSLFAALVLATIGDLGTVMALCPHQANVLRMRLPGQGDSPDWYIRLLGVVCGVFSLTVAVLLVFVAK